MSPAHSNWRRLHCFGIACLATTFLLPGCTPLGVNIDRKPATVERKFLDKAQVEQLIKEEGREAHTDWVFACESDLGFHIESKDVSPGYAKVDLKITQVNLKLSLPIVVWIEKDARPYVVSHEDGHVEICKRIYDNAEKAARLSADGVLGRTFMGQGDTLDQACKQALNLAVAELHESYHKQTLESANRISEAYDHLCDSIPDEKQVAAELVQKCFDEDHLNAPQRLQK